MEEFDEVLEAAVLQNGFKFQQELVEKMGITRQTIATWRRAGDVARLKKALQKMEAKAAPASSSALKVHPALKNALMLQNQNITHIICRELLDMAEIEEDNGSKYLVWQNEGEKIKIEKSKNTIVDHAGSHYAVGSAMPHLRPESQDLIKIDEVFGVSKAVKQLSLSLGLE